MFEAMTWLQANRDDLRLRMLREPRGYPAANCNLILPSAHPEADAGYVIMEQVEYPGMSGTNTMCVVTVLLETGPAADDRTDHRADPRGARRAHPRDAPTAPTARSRGVTFRNVPAFATHLDATIEVPHLGTVTVDVAYGGMFYVIADAERFGLRLTPDEGGDIVRITEMIKAAAAEQLPVVHPDQPGFAGITIGQLSGPAHDPANRSTQRRSRSRPARSTGSGRPPGPARSTARRAGPGRRPRWRCCMPRAGCAVGEDVPPRGHPRHGLHRARARGDDDRGRTGRSCRASPARPGSPGFARVRRGPHRPVPRRLHDRRHLGLRAWRRADRGRPRRPPRPYRRK